METTKHCQTCDFGKFGCRFAGLCGCCEPAVAGRMAKHGFLVEVPRLVERHNAPDQPADRPDRALALTRTRSVASGRAAQHRGGQRLTRPGLHTASLLAAPPGRPPPATRAAGRPRPDLHAGPHPNEQPDRGGRASSSRSAPSRAGRLLVPSSPSAPRMLPAGLSARKPLK